MQQQPKQQLELILTHNPQLRQIFQNKDYWALNSHRFTQTWKHIFSIMTTVQTEELWLDQNNDKSIIEALIPIQFTAIKNHAANNNIANIQPIVHLKAELLQELNLDSNKICVTRCLRKCYFPRLQYISIADNPVNDIERLTEMNSKLSRLDLEYNDSEVIGYDMSWMLKLSSSLLSRAYIQSRNRIIRPSLTRMFLQKHKAIEIFQKDI